MASDKNSMLSTANSYINRVSAAKNACESAARNCGSPIIDVSDSWNGDSGAAIKQALDNLRTEINRVSARLTVLESNMRNRATSIYNSWPAEKKQEPAKTTGSQKASKQTNSKSGGKVGTNANGGVIGWLKKLF